MRFDLSKASTCCLCNEKSTSKSPLKEASDLDRWGGRRPWSKYRKVAHEQSVFRVPEGKLCLICRNVYYALGLQHKYASYADYHRQVCKDGNSQAHQKFMAALQKYIEQHNKDPGRAKLRDVQALRDAKPKMQSNNRTGLMVKAPEREFVLQSDWDPAVDGEWDEAKVEQLEIAGKMERGIYKEPAKKGRYKVQEYFDTGVEETKEIQSGEGPFADEAMAAAREAAQSSWHSGRAEREKASVKAPATATSSPSGLNLDEVLKLVQQQHAGQTAADPEAAAAAAPAAAETKAEPASEEESSEEEADHAGALASTFSVKPAKAPKAKVAPKPKPQPKAAPRASEAPTAPAPLVQAPAGATKAGGKSQPSKARASTAGTAGEDKPATLVLDGRGQRLQESLLKVTGQVEEGLKLLNLSADTDLDATETKKARTQRSKKLNQYASWLKQQLKRVQDSANRAALTDAENKILSCQEVVTACQHMATALAATSPEVEQIDAALKTLEKSHLAIPLQTDAWTKIHSARVAHFVLYRQYDEACRLYRPSCNEVKHMLLTLPRAAVEDLAVLDLSTRVTCLLRAIASAEVTKDDSDSKQQVKLLCQAILNEIGCAEQEFLGRLASQAEVVARLLDHSDLSGLKKALQRVDDFAASATAEAEAEKADDSTWGDDRPVLQFFLEHKVGMALVAHARQVLKGKAYDAELEEQFPALDAMLEDLSQIKQVDNQALKNLILPIWAKIQEAKAAATQAKRAGVFKLQAEKCTARFMETCFQKVRSDLQEGMLGFFDYILDAFEHQGLVVNLDEAHSADAARKPLDLGMAIDELYHDDRLLSQFWKDLEAAQSLPAAVRELLDKDAFVRGHVRDLVIFVFCKTGMLPAESVRALQKQTPTAETLALWADDLSVAAEEILPDTPGNRELLKRFWKAFQAPVLAELNTAALAAYREIGDLVDCCREGKSNKTVVDDMVRKLLLKLPASCSLKPLWSAFFQVAPRLHELESSHMENLPPFSAAMDRFKEMLSKVPQYLTDFPEKLSATKMDDLGFTAWYQEQVCKKNELMAAQRIEKQTAACKAGLACVKALQAIPNPELREKEYRAVLATNAPTWASAAAAGRQSAEALQDAQAGNSAEDSGRQVASATKNCAALLSAHITFFAGLTLLRAPESAARSAEGKANGKKLDTLLSAFWSLDFPQVPRQEHFPHEHVLKVLREMAEAVTRALGSCSAKLAGEDCWERRSQNPEVDLRAYEKLLKRKSCLFGDPAGPSGPSSQSGSSNKGAAAGAPAEAASVEQEESSQSGKGETKRPREEGGLQEQDLLQALVASPGKCAKHESEQAAESVDLTQADSVAPASPGRPAVPEARPAGSPTLPAAAGQSSMREVAAAPAPGQRLQLAAAEKESSQQQPAAATAATQQHLLTLPPAEEQMPATRSPQEALAATAAESKEEALSTAAESKKPLLAKQADTQEEAPVKAEQASATVAVAETKEQQPENELALFSPSPSKEPKPSKEAAGLKQKEKKEKKDKKQKKEKKKEKKQKKRKRTEQEQLEKDARKELKRELKAIQEKARLSTEALLKSRAKLSKKRLQQSESTHAVAGTKGSKGKAAAGKAKAQPKATAKGKAKAAKAKASPKTEAKASAAKSKPQAMPTAKGLARTLAEQAGKVADQEQKGKGENSSEAPGDRLAEQLRAFDWSKSPEKPQGKGS